MPLPYARELPRADAAGAPPPPEPGFWEQALAAARVASDETDDAQRARIDMAFSDLAEALKERGYDQRSLTREKPWYQLGPQFRVDYGKVWSAVEAERTRDPAAFSTLPRTREQFERAAMARNGGRAADQAMLARGSGLTSIAAGIVGATASDVDSGPLGPLTFMVGAGGQSALWRILGEGVVNAAQEAVMTPERMRARKALGEPMTGADAAIGIGEAFAGGALFAGVGEGFGRFVLPKSQEAFERVVASNWDRLPDGLRARWEARATLEPAKADLLLADMAEAVIGPERLSVSEADALAVIRREAAIDAANPFLRNGAGEAAHLDALAQTMARIMADEPATKPAFVPPATGGILPRAATDVPGMAGARSGTAMATGVVPGDAQARFMARVRAAESAGNDTAAAATSSAFGRYQFTKGTWISYFTRRFGTMGLSREQILARRSNGRLQDQLMADLTADNAAALRRIGAPVTEGNLYLAHFLGQKDAAKVLQARPDARLNGLISADAIAANPGILDGRTAGELLAWANRKMGSTGGGLHVRPDLDMEAQLRAQIDAELETLRVQSQQMEAELAAQGVDIEAEVARMVDESAAPDAREAAMARDSDLVPVDATPEPVLAPEPPWRPPDARGPFDLNAPPREITALLPAIRRFVDDSKRNLNAFAEMASELGVPETDLRQAMMVLAREKGSGLAIRRKDGRYIRRPAISRRRSRGDGPEDVLEFIARHGGIRDDEGHGLGLKGVSAREKREMPSREALRSLKERRAGGGRGWQMMTRFNGPLLRHEGNSIDRIGELLWGAGYLEGSGNYGRPMVDEVLQFIEQRISAKKPMFTMEDMARAQTPSGPEEGTYPIGWGGKRLIEGEELIYYMDRIEEAAVNAFGFRHGELDPEFLEYAAQARQQADDFPDAEEAFVRAVNDYATAALMDSVDETGDLRYEAAYGDDPEYRSEDFGLEAGDPGPAPDTADPWPGESGPWYAGDDPAAGQIPLEDLPREEIARFLDPDGEAAARQSDALEHDARMVADNAPIDPAIAERLRQEAQLRAAAPLRAKAEQDGTMGLGLFDQADAPQFNLGDDNGPTDLRGLFEKLDGEADDLGTIRDCMVPKPKVDGAG